MKSMKTVGAVTLAAALAATLAACQPQNNGGPSGDETTPPAVSNTDLASETAEINPLDRDAIADGGTLTTSLPEITPQMNPFHSGGTLYTTTLWQWYNPVLALYTPDGEWSFNDDYLVSVEDRTEGDNTVVTYTIRDEAVFNDGTPIDWRAFEVTWQANKTYDSDFQPSSTDGYERIISVEPGENDKQAVVTFGDNWAWWRGQFNQVLHPDAAKDAETFNTAYDGRNPHPEWGAGPYQVKEITETTAIFERNPKWWGDKGKLDQRIYVQMESQASLNAFRNGEIDATGVGTKDRMAQVEGMDGIEIRRSATPSNGLIALNAEAENLEDVKVRQAILKAIDRKTILDITYDGMDYTEEQPGSFMLFPWQDGYRDNVTEAGMDYNVDEAKALLDEAGWTEGSDGIREKDGTRLEIRYTTTGDAPVTKARAAAFQDMLKQIGVDLKIENVASAEFSKTYNERTFEFFLLGFSSTDPFGPAYFCQLYCSDSGLNFSSTGSKEFDAKIREAASIGDPDEQIKALNELEVEAFQLGGIFPTENGPTIVAVKEGLANYGAGLFFLGKPQDVGWAA